MFQSRLQLKPTLYAGPCDAGAVTLELTPRSAGGSYWALPTRRERLGGGKCCNQQLSAPRAQAVTSTLWFSIPPSKPHHLPCTPPSPSLKFQPPNLLSSIPGQLLRAGAGLLGGPPAQCALPFALSVLPVTTNSIKSSVKIIAVVCVSGLAPACYTSPSPSPRGSQTDSWPRGQCRHRHTHTQRGSPWYPGLSSCPLTACT